MVGLGLDNLPFFQKLAVQNFAERLLYGISILMASLVFGLHSWSIVVESKFGMFWLQLLGNSPFKSQNTN